MGDANSGNSDVDAAIRKAWMEEEEWHLKNATTDLSRFMRPVAQGAAISAAKIFDLEGNEVSLAALWQQQPLVLVTGSLTCPPSRLFNPALNELADEFAGRCSVAIVYVIDAHPSDDVCPYTGTYWVTRDNDEAGLLVAQPRSLVERLELARRYVSNLGLHVTVVVDDMGNGVWEVLGRSPNAALVIDADGTCRYWQDWFRPMELRQQLAELLSGEEETGT